MANVTEYLQQNIGNFSVSNFLKSKIPGISKTDDKQEVGIGGFTAYVTINESRKLTSVAPDVTLEDQSVVSDTIFLRPITITIEGEVSDVNIKLENDPSLFEQASQAVGSVTQYLPARTQAQLNKVGDLVDDAVSIVSKIDSYIDSGRQILGIFGDQSGNKSPQEQFIDVIDSIHFTKSLVNLETQFRLYDNMRITNFETSQDNKSKKIMFRIDAKQIRFAELNFTETKSSANVNPSSDLGGQVSGETDKGVTAGDAPSESLLSVIGGFF